MATGPVYRDMLTTDLRVTPARFVLACMFPVAWRWIRSRAARVSRAPFGTYRVVFAFGFSRSAACGATSGLRCRPRASLLDAVTSNRVTEWGTVGVRAGPLIESASTLAGIGRLTISIDVEIMCHLTDTLSP